MRVALGHLAVGEAARLNCGCLVVITDIHPNNHFYDGVYNPGCARHRDFWHWFHSFNTDSPMAGWLGEVEGAGSSSPH